MTFRAVIFDWRGTLVVTPTAAEWVADAFHRLGTNAPARDIDLTVEAIRRADGSECRLDAHGLDADSALHRGTFLEVFADAGLPDELAIALYESESDFRRNRFADDVDESLRGGAVECGITTLLVPPLTDVSDRRLHRALALCAPTV